MTGAMTARVGPGRLDMGQREHRICTNCVMDTTDSMITFDADGMCDHCTTFYRDIRPNWHTDERGRVALERVIERIKREGRGKDFDCILGVSGGIDSSYLTDRSPMVPLNQGGFG